MDGNSCCFTGHRDIPQGQYERIKEILRDEINALIDRGVHVFYAGGALGFDMLAEELVLSIREKRPEVELVLALPCKGQEKKWSYDEIRRYNSIKESCDRYTYLSEEYRRGCMHVRNRFMVDNSQYCICYMTKDTGGTAYTAKYAVGKGLTVINIADKLY